MLFAQLKVCSIYTLVMRVLIQSPLRKRNWSYTTRIGLQCNSRRDQDSQFACYTHSTTQTNLLMRHL